jgi:hypothetical protein
MWGFLFNQRLAELDQSLRIVELVGVQESWPFGCPIEKRIKAISSSIARSHSMAGTPTQIPRVPLQGSEVHVPALR